MTVFENKYLPKFVFMEQIHRGQIVKKRIDESGIPISAIADSIGYNRTRFYPWFENKNLGYDIILKIGKEIHWDFRKDFPDLFINDSDTVEEPAAEYGKKPLTDLEKCQNEAQMWRERYYDLMEKHNDVLSGAIGRLMKKD